MQTSVVKEDVMEAAALLFQIARRHSFDYENSKIDNNKSLRKTMAKSILNEAKSMRPDLDDNIWKQASCELTKRQ